MKINNVEFEFNESLSDSGYNTIIVGDGGTARSGILGTAISHASGKSITGDYGFSLAMSGGIAETGEDGRAIVGCGGRAKAGFNGSIHIYYYDGKTCRMANGYVGENGIKANTFYHVQNGKLVECESDE